MRGLGVMAKGEGPDVAAISITYQVAFYRAGCVPAEAGLGCPWLPIALL